jgi:hypothetical protein
VVDVGGGEEIAMEGCRDFAAEALGLEELQLLPGVEGTEERMGRAAQPYGSSGRRKSETGSAWRYQCWNSY